MVAPLMLPRPLVTPGHEPRTCTDCGDGYEPPLELGWDAMPDGWRCPQCGRDACARGDHLWVEGGWFCIRCNTERP